MGSYHATTNDHNGDYTTGYGLLNGTNSLVGDFQYWGYAQYNKDKTVTYFLNMAWNDIIDPNSNYIIDTALEKYYKKVGEPQNYQVHIQWSDVITIPVPNY